MLAVEAVSNGVKGYNSTAINIAYVGGISVTIMLIYDSTRTQTISDYTTKYTARIINRQY